jgi:hypothetical protein
VGSKKNKSSKTESLSTRFEFWRKLTLDQRISFVMLICVVFILPLGVILVLSPKIPLFPQASPGMKVINSFPEIRTGSLPQGELGESYHAVVLGYDDDFGEELTMKIRNLPPGLSQKECVARSGEARIYMSCKIAGVPRKDGLFKVGVELTDSKRASDVETLKLIVVRDEDFFPVSF